MDGVVGWGAVALVSRLQPPRLDAAKADLAAARRKESLRLRLVDHGHRPIGHRGRLELAHRMRDFFLRLAPHERLDVLATACAKPRPTVGSPVGTEGRRAFIQNLWRGHYEVAVEVPANRPVAVAFEELASQSDPEARLGLQHAAFRTTQQPAGLPREAASNARRAA